MISRIISFLFFLNSYHFSPNSFEFIFVLPNPSHSISSYINWYIFVPYSRLSILPLVLENFFFSNLSFWFSYLEKNVPYTTIAPIPTTHLHWLPHILVVASDSCTTSYSCFTTPNHVQALFTTHCTSKPGLSFFVPCRNSLLLVLGLLMRDF